jgi:hypothetical protein
VRWRLYTGDRPIAQAFAALPMSCIDTRSREEMAPRQKAERIATTPKSGPMRFELRGDFR